MPDSLSKKNLETIREVLDIVSSSHVGQLGVKQLEALSIKVRTIADAPDVVAPVYAPVNEAQSATLSSASAASSEAPSSTATAHRGTPILSPMVGVFYSSQSPGEPPLVKVGDLIRVGQTIGLIEAMKVYSEIPAEIGGTVVEIVAKNGVMMQLDQPIMYVEPS